MTKVTDILFVDATCTTISHLFGFATFINDLHMVSGDTHIDGLVQDCSNSIANALELLQSCAKHSRNYMDRMKAGHNIYVYSGKKKKLIEVSVG